MKQFKIGDKEVNLTTEWEELTLQQLLDFDECIRSRELFEIEELFMLRIFEILCNVEPDGLDEMDIDQLQDMNAAVQPLLGKKPEKETVECLTINGIEYYLDKNFQGKRNMLELKVMGLIRSRFTKERDIVPRMLAVIVRPGRVEVNKETGKKDYILDKLKLDDIEPRAEIFLKSQNALDFMQYLSFFLSGSK